MSVYKVWLYLFISAPLWAVVWCIFPPCKKPEFSLSLFLFLFYFSLVFKLCTKWFPAWICLAMLVDLSEFCITGCRVYRAIVHHKFQMTEHNLSGRKNSHFPLLSTPPPWTGVHSDGWFGFFRLKCQPSERGRRKNERINKCASLFYFVLQCCQKNPL